MALTSATCKSLISVFHTFASYILSRASPCNDQIPNLTTASASRDGASPTSPQVVDDSISVVVDGSPPIDDGTIRTLNAHGTRTTTTARSPQVRTFNSSQPSAVHPIAVLFQRQELGKAVLGFAVPMATGLLFSQYKGLTHLQASAIVLALSIGIAIAWNGILLHEICPRVATALESLGAVTILTSFFGLVSSFLSPSLLWACWLCCGFSCLPFILCLVLPAEIEKESSAERLDQDVV